MLFISVICRDVSQLPCYSTTIRASPIHTDTKLEL